MCIRDSCPYNPDGYRSDTAKTYYGEAMAVLRGGETGSVTVTVTDEQREYRICIPSEEGEKC